MYDGNFNWIFLGIGERKLNMEQREMENAGLYKMTKLFFIINIVLYFLQIFAMFYSILMNCIFLFLFDITYCGYVFSSIEANKQGFTKRLCYFLISLGLFAFINLNLEGEVTNYFGIEVLLHFIYILALTVFFYIAGLFSRHHHSVISTIIVLASIVAGYLAVKEYILMLWRLITRFEYF